jgi:hypothetical protein
LLAQVFQRIATQVGLPTELLDVITAIFEGQRTESTARQKVVQWEPLQKLVWSVLPGGRHQHVFRGLLAVMEGEISETMRLVREAGELDRGANSAKNDKVDSKVQLAMHLSGPPIPLPPAPTAAATASSTATEIALTPTEIPPLTLQGDSITGPPHDALAKSTDASAGTAAHDTTTDASAAVVAGGSPTPGAGGAAGAGGVSKVAQDDADDAFSEAEVLMTLLNALVAAVKQNQDASRVATRDIARLLVRLQWPGASHTISHARQQRWIENRLLSLSNFARGSRLDVTQMAELSGVDGAGAAAIVQFSSDLDSFDTFEDDLHLKRDRVCIGEVLRLLSLGQKKQRVLELFALLRCDGHLVSDPPLLEMPTMCLLTGTSSLIAFGAAVEILVIWLHGRAVEADPERTEQDKQDVRWMFWARVRKLVATQEVGRIFLKQEELSPWRRKDGFLESSDLGLTNLGKWPHKRRNESIGFKDFKMELKRYKFPSFLLEELGLNHSSVSLVKLLARVVADRREHYGIFKRETIRKSHSLQGAEVLQEAVQGLSDMLGIGNAKLLLLLDLWIGDPAKIFLDESHEAEDELDEEEEESQRRERMKLLRKLLRTEAGKSGEARITKFAALWIQNSGLVRGGVKAMGHMSRKIGVHPVYVAQLKLLGWANEESVRLKNVGDYISKVLIEPLNRVDETTRDEDDGNGSIDGRTPRMKRVEWIVHIGTQYTPHCTLYYTPLIHSSRALSSHALFSYSPLIPSSHALFSHTPLIHSSHTLLSCTLLSYTPLIPSSHTLLSYTPLIHSSHTLLSYPPSYSRLMPSSHTLLSYTPLVHSSHTLPSYTPLIHSSHTLLSYTPLIHSSRTLLSYTPLISSSRTLFSYPSSHALLSCPSSHTLLSCPSSHTQFTLTVQRRRPLSSRLLGPHCAPQSSRIQARSLAAVLALALGI